MATSNLRLTLKHSCKSMAQIHQLHAQAVTSGLFFPLLSSHILQSFITFKNFPQKNDSIIYISKIFELIPNPSTFNYNCIIRAHTLLCSPHTAFNLFLEMSRRPIAPDLHTFPVVLNACKVLQNSHSLAKSLHALVTKFGFLDDVYVHTTLSCTYGKSGDIVAMKWLFEGSLFRNVVSYTTMIDGFCKAGQIDGARELFDEMPASLRNVVTYNVILDGFCKAGHIDRASELFDEMPRSLRDVVSYNTMIDGLAKAEQIDRATELFDEIPRSMRSVVSYNAMINGFFKAGGFDRAKELFDGMPRSLRNVVSYNTMICGFMEDGLIDHARELCVEMPETNADLWCTLLNECKQLNRCVEVIELFNNMMDSGVQINNVALTSLLSACAQLGKLEKGKEIHGYIERNGIELGAYIGSALVDLYAKCGCIEMAKEVFWLCSEKDVALWNAMLMGLAIHGDGGSMLQYLSRMLEEGVKPDGVSISIVLVGCSHYGLINDAKRIFVEMESVYAVPNEVHHYRIMVDVLARAGLIKEAREIIEGMPMEADAIVWGALLGGCKKHGDIEGAEEAAKHVMQLKPGDSYAYSALTNMYANSERWDDVVKLRRLRNHKGIKKKVGCSWIC